MAISALRRVVVATDFGARAEDALERALWLPWGDGVGELCLLHAAPEADRSDGDPRLHRAVDAARRVADDRRLRLTIHARLERGDAADVVAAHAASWSADLIVVGASRAQTLRTLLGRSTAHLVVNRSEVPVLVVHRAAPEPYARPLVALDTVPQAASLVSLVARVVDRRTLVHVLHVVEPPFGRFVSSDCPNERRAALRARALAEVQRIVRSARSPLGTVCQVVVEAREPRVVLTEEIERAHSDLVVLGTRARSMWARAFFGSFAASVLSGHPPCDVLVQRTAPRPQARLAPAAAGPRVANRTNATHNEP